MTTTCLIAKALLIMVYAQVKMKSGSVCGDRRHNGTGVPPRHGHDGEVRYLPLCWYCLSRFQRRGFA
jgi:hypothetical protein